MNDELPGRDTESANRAKSDGLASIAIMLLAVALLIFVITKIV